MTDTKLFGSRESSASSPLRTPISAKKPGQAVAHTSIMAHSVFSYEFIRSLGGCRVVLVVWSSDVHTAMQHNALAHIFGIERPGVHSTSESRIRVSRVEFRTQESTRRPCIVCKITSPIDTLNLHCLL
jgi:hypothetical protein